MWHYCSSKKKLSKLLYLTPFALKDCLPYWLKLDEIFPASAGGQKVGNPQRGVIEKWEQLNGFQYIPSKKLDSKIAHYKSQLKPPMWKGKCIYNGMTDFVIL